MNKASHRKNKSILLLGASLITFGCVLAVTSLAWFCPPQSSHSVSGGITGKATGSYFESGNGSSSSPYIIATPRQLYYFNWLQDLGYFNTDSDNDGTIDTVYFRIEPKDGGKELDMGKYVLPPAGTSSYPFVGNFDGNEVVLKDLTITNSYTELNEDGMRPIKASEDSSVSGMLSDAEIVGFFGVIGQYSTEAYGSTKVTNDDESTTTTITGHASETSSQKSLPYNIRVEDKDKDGKETTTTYINAVNDLYFENLTIKSAANSVLAGFIAGYANGQIDNCGVQCGQFSFIDGVSNFSDDVLTETSLSKYALIGDCTSNLKWKNQPGVDDSEDGNDWGGSIDISSLAKRVTYMKKQICGELNPTGSSSNNTKTYTSSIYNVSLYERAVSGDGYKFDFDWSTFDDSIPLKTDSYICFQEGTYLPLNIDLTKATIKDEKGNDYTDSTTPALGSFYDGSTAETVLPTNTGYVVGIKSATSAYPRIQKKKSEASSSSVGIRYSIATQLNGTDETDDSKMFANDNFAFYMYDTSEGKTKRIEDDSNKSNATTFDKSGITATCSSSSFAKYSQVKTEFISMLKSSSTNARSKGKLLLEALRMYNFRSYTFSDNRYTATNSTVSLNGKTYSSYQFQNGGFNFTVSKPGILTMILGTYASATSGHCGLDLYQVNRDSSGNITACDESTRIKKIYTSSDGKEISYNSSSGNATNLSIDMDTIASKTGVLSANCAYYFEIPVTTGDYFLSKVTRDDSNSSSLPYVLYLDIGANSGDEEEKTTDPLPTNIDFVYKNEGSIVKITEENYAPSGVTFALSGSGSSSGLLYFKRNTSSSGVIYYVDTGYSVTVAGLEKNAVSKKTKEEYDNATA